MRLSRQARMMRVAREIALGSTCARRLVGCVLTDAAGKILATGYNGRASGLPHCNEGHPCAGATAASGTQLDACEAVHAEQNALLQCANVRSIEACFTTSSPCVTCTKLLLNTTCRTVYFLEEYPQPAARRLWESAGRSWVQLTDA